MASVGQVEVADRHGVAAVRDTASQSAVGRIGQGGDREIVLRVDAGQISVR